MFGLIWLRIGKRADIVDMEMNLGIEKLWRFDSC